MGEDFPLLYHSQLVGNMKKQIGVMLGIFALVVLLLIIPSVSAQDFWACFGNGDRINFCDSRIADRTCTGSVCKYCMDFYSEEFDCFAPGNFNACNSGGGQCSEFGTGGGGIDADAPVMTFQSPLSNSLHTERRVLIDVDVDEEADIYYTDLDEGRGRWTRLCTDCSSYAKERSFSDGENSLRFRSTDSSGNEAFFDVTFFIDSKEPRVSRTEPRKGFANGFFSVQFKEDNPETLVLHYGVFGNMKLKNLNIVNDCTENRGTFSCDTSVPLAEFDGQTISYWFTLTDIAGNSADSKVTELQVDITPPVINSIDFELDDNRATFTFDITEPNFDEIEYIDNSASRPKWKRICSKLKEGMCEGRISLRELGEHDIDFQVIDEAGNIIGANRIINVI